jgi:ketosteroid isomerase-like protein
MARANTPEEISRLAAEAITSADLDAASLYEPDATFVMPSALGDGSVTGLPGLREAFTGFLAMSPVLTINPERTVVSSDTALVIGNLDAVGPRRGRT